MKEPQVITVDRFCAAVCLNGHVLEDFLNPPPMPNLIGVPRFCGQCGARVLRACGTCGEPLLGAYKFNPRTRWHLEPFCQDCGAPYPWATREQRINQLYALVDDEDLVDEADLLAVREQIAVLSKPDVEVTEEQRVRAGETIKRLAPKAWEVFRPVAQSVLEAEVKRRLGLP